MGTRGQGDRPEGATAIDTATGRERPAEGAPDAKRSRSEGRPRARNAAGTVGTVAGVGCAGVSFAGLAIAALLIVSLVAAANSCSHLFEPPCSRTGAELPHAAYLGDRDTVDRLLREGADVNQRDASGVTPLACAADAGRLDVAASLLAGGADASTLSPERQDQLLVRAAAANDAATTTALFDHGATLARDGATTGTTVPGAAPTTSNPGPSPSVAPPVSPVVAAATRAGAADVLRVLVAHGADPNEVLRAAITNAPVSSPITFDLGPALPSVPGAPADRRLALVDLALDLGASPSGLPSLDAAATDADPRFLARLLDRGADPNAGGGLPLAHAAAQGRTEQVRTLLAHGADPNLPTDGGSALLWASALAHGEIVDALLAAGADPNGGGRSTASDISDAISFAGEQQHQPAEVTRWVEGAIGARSDGTEVPPIIVAATWDHWDVVAKLLAAGADPDRPLGGLTAASAAAAFDHPTTLRLLLDAGASPGRPGPADPLPVAHDRQAREVEALLHAAGR